MDNRGSGLGCIVTGLGLVLVILLFPYIMSSVYSVANAIWQAGGAATWLWGDWVNTWTNGDGILYMLLSEGPMCCGGGVALLILIVGIVAIISERGEEEEYDVGYESEDPATGAEEDLAEGMPGAQGTAHVDEGLHEGAADVE